MPLGTRDGSLIAISVPSIFLRKYAGFQAMCRIGRPLPGEEKVDRVAGDGMSTGLRYAVVSSGRTALLRAILILTIPAQSGLLNRQCLLGTIQIAADLYGKPHRLSFAIQAR